MNEEIAKICRICLAEGSQNIFHNNRRNVDTISSLDRILEKLRFVTMLKIQPNDCLPGMICDSCIVQLNVAYSFKMKAIESDTKLHQYAIEKGFGLQETSYNLAITDSQHTCNFIVPEPLHQQRAISHTVIQSTDNIATATALQQEYLRHFETPQSMSSTRPTSDNEKLSSSTTGQPPFRCMPIQIKVEPLDDYLASSEVSPAASDENLQTVSDASSIRSNQGSNENLSGSSMVCVNKKTSERVIKTSDNGSDKSFVNEYISSGPSTSSGSSMTTKSSPSKSSDKAYSPQEKEKPEKESRKRPLRTKQNKTEKSETKKVEPKTKAPRRGRKRESDILQSSFNSVKLGSSSKKQQNKAKSDANSSMTTKSGRKISFIVDLNESKRQSRIRESQDRRRKEVREKLKGQTGKKQRT